MLADVAAHGDGLLLCLLYALVVGVVVALVCAAIRAAGAGPFALAGWPGLVGLVIGLLWFVLCL